MRLSPTARVLSRPRTGALRRLALVAIVAGIAACGPPLETVVYDATDEVFANPERGFYLPADTHAGRYHPLDVEALRSSREDRQISLVYRGFILDDFVDAPISEAYLRAMAADFAALRQAGMKAIVRFAYTTHARTAPGTGGPPLPPYGDAPPERVLAHVDQLEPLLRAHADVIAVVQAGFIGIWGEWFYTDHFAGADLDAPTDAAWEDRRRVVTRLLAALPPPLAVQVRTPLQKQRLTGSTEPLSPRAAFSAAAPARLGHHNDCFLASDTDYGTYRDTTAERAYLEADSRFVPVGGETCHPQPPRSECGSALRELARFHWSYLNSGYHRGVLASWEAGGCLDDVRRRLGYRLALSETRFAPEAQPAGAWTLELDLTNDGFAAPFRPRPVGLVLQQRGTRRTYRADLDVDLRRLLPADTLTVKARVGLPADMPAGLYDAFLHLGDADAGLAPRPEYAVRLAVADAWDAGTGTNALGLALAVRPGRAWLPARATTYLRETTSTAIPPVAVSP